MLERRRRTIFPGYMRSFYLSPRLGGMEREEDGWMRIYAF